MADIISERAKRLAVDIGCGCIRALCYGDYSFETDTAAELIQAALDAEAAERAAWYKLLARLEHGYYIAWNEHRKVLVLFDPGKNYKPENTKEIPCEFDADGLPVETEALRTKLEELL